MATTQQLSDLLPKLTESDQGFAKSLILNATRRSGASSKMQIWIDKLVARAESGSSDVQTAQVGNMTGVLNLFENAAKHMKRKAPAIVVKLGETVVRLTRAGSKARDPGSINVVSVGTGAWYGAVTTEGTFKASRKFDTPAGLVDGLVEFAASPAKVAAEHGHATGRCCFCDLPLGGQGGDTGKKSLAVGYGETCAKHWGVAWGKQKFEFSDQPQTEVAA